MICPTCKQDYNDWKEASIPCDTCGGHDAVQCPGCDEVYDTIWGFPKILEVNPDVDIWDCVAP